MRPLTTFPEDFMLGLLPKVVQDTDQNGYVRAVLGAWQDRVEQLRALVDQYSSLVDPTEDQAKDPNCLLLTFNTIDGATVTRHIYLNPSYGPVVAILNTIATSTDPAQVAALNAQLRQWAAQLLNIYYEGGTVSSVRLGHDPLMAINNPTTGLLAKTLGVLSLPADTNSIVLGRLAATQLTWATAKGTPRALAYRLYALGFNEVCLAPLWSRLAPRLKSAWSGAEFDYRPCSDSPPEALDYDPTTFRDGPYFQWAQTCSLLSQANFYMAVNGASPFIQVTLGGLAAVNHRGLFKPAATYAQGDLVTFSTGKVYVATGFPTGDPSSTASTGWTQLFTPDAGQLVTLSGGVENIRASAQLLYTPDPANHPTVTAPTGIVVRAIAPGADFNGLVVSVGDYCLQEQLVANIDPLAAGSQAFESQPTPAGQVRLVYVGGGWGPTNGSVQSGWWVTEAPTSSVPSHVVLDVQHLEADGTTVESLTFPEPVPGALYTSLAAVESTCRDMEVDFQHHGGVIRLVTFPGGMPGGMTFTVGHPPPTFNLFTQQVEMRTLSVFDRLSRVKFRSSNYDVIVANSTTPVESVQPSLSLQANPREVYGVTAVSPWRPFGGPPVGSPAVLTQVGVQRSDGSPVLQLDETALATSESLLSSVVADWSPCTRTPRRAQVGVQVRDTWRVAPYPAQTVLFTTRSQLIFTLTGFAGIALPMDPDTPILFFITFGDPAHHYPVPLQAYALSNFPNGSTVRMTQTSNPGNYFDALVVTSGLLSVVSSHTDTPGFFVDWTLTASPIITGTVTLPLPSFEAVIEADTPDPIPAGCWLTESGTAPESMAWAKEDGTLWLLELA